MDTTTTTRSRKATTYLPDSTSQEDIVDFARMMRELEAYLKQNHSKAALIAPDGKSRPIPDEVFRALEQVASALANGNGVTVAPYNMLMTTQDAADFLGISRPTLVKILDNGEIEHEKRNRHRRVTLRDLVDYQSRSRTERRTALADLASTGHKSAAGVASVPKLTRRSED